LLDSSLRKVRDLGDSAEGALKGAIYEVTAPATRKGDGLRHLYLDLHQ